jgi:hypothetical protein
MGGPLVSELDLLAGIAGEVYFGKGVYSAEGLVPHTNPGGSPLS